MTDSEVEEVETSPNAAAAKPQKHAGKGKSGAAGPKVQRKSGKGKAAAALRCSRR